MNAAARQIIAALKLEPLPQEGGYFRATWRNEHASAIYFLITPNDFSAFHRLAQDEMWHFYAGDAVEHVQLKTATRGPRVSLMGPNVSAGQSPQVVVAAKTWQGAKLAASSHAHGFALLGCTVTPPWDERGFELASREALLRDFAGHETVIRALTR